MGGTNPYIQKQEVDRPDHPFRVTFVNADLTVDVDPGKIPYGPTGQPGSILDIALGAGLEIEHVCGGVCACSTCHVIVRQGLESCNEATDDEMDQLEEAPATTLQSRLACQTVPNGTKDLVVEVPDWNINLAKENH